MFDCSTHQIPGVTFEGASPHSSHPNHALLNTSINTPALPISLQLYHLIATTAPNNCQFLITATSHRERAAANIPFGNALHAPSRNNSLFKRA